MPSKKAPETELMLDRGLPASVEAERTILGTILLDNVLLNEAREMLDKDDFSLDSHRRIFARMLELQEASHAIDVVTVANALDMHKELEAIGDRPYLWSLTESLPRRLSIVDYVRIVKEKAQLRAVLVACNIAMETAADQSVSPGQVVADLQGKLYNISESDQEKRLMSIGAFVAEYPSIDSIFETSQKDQGILTGIDEFDELTCGLQRQDLIIVAARPSMGKTAWAINIAQNAALRHGKVVAIFSLEMSKEALLRRMVSSAGSIDGQNMRHARLTPSERIRAAGALGTLLDSGLYIDDESGLTLSKMRAKAAGLKAKRKGLDLIVIDYLGLMGSDGKAENRTQEMSKISRGCKGLAKDLNVPVVALSQLSRSLESRGDKRPMLSDLRETGAIEQDADVVAFIHREEYYEPTPENAGVAEIIVAKQRNGPIGTVKADYVRQFCQFLPPPATLPFS